MVPVALSDQGSGGRRDQREGEGAQTINQLHAPVAWKGTDGAALVTAACGARGQAPSGHGAVGCWGGLAAAGQGGEGTCPWGDAPVVVVSDTQQVHQVSEGA